jgi:hypothetical protein
MKVLMPGTPKIAPAPPKVPEPVSPGELQPGPSRIVGAVWPGPTPFPTNQCAAILVPSKEVIVTSFALAAGAEASAPAMTAAMGSPPRTLLHMARDGTTARAASRRS